MYSFKELRKASKSNIDEIKAKAVILGNISTQFFAMALKGYSNLTTAGIDIYDTDYNQIDIQLINPSSEVYASNPDFIIIWLASEKLYEEYMTLSYDLRKTFAEDCMNRILNYWNLIHANSNARILQMNFPEINDYSLGNFSAKIDHSFIYQIRKLNFLLEEEMCRTNGVFPVDVASLQNSLGRVKFYSAQLYFSSKMNVTTDALPYVAKAVIDVINSCLGRIKKCVVLDLDNTLWGGVVGDLGVDNIEIGELGKGNVFAEFQQWLKTLKNNGIILAVCSKNDEHIAREPFDKHPEMVLKYDDFAMFVSNWDDKATNIRLIRDTLNIGMDSIVFIDDNPFERNLVKELIPEITVPDLPEDPANYLEFLISENFFETASYSKDGSERTDLYRAEFEREKSRKGCASLDEYLMNLNMVCNVSKFDSTKYSRIAQLTQRSNQFNLRTKRYTDDEIAQMANSDDFETISFTLRDRFGDSGLVGIIIMKRTSSRSMFIDTWIVSCRVLKRGMEEFMINKAVELAKARNVNVITAEYIPTEKNRIVKDLYPSVGFEFDGDNCYKLETDKYKAKNVFIMEEK